MWSAVDTGGGQEPRVESGLCQAGSENNDPYMIKSHRTGLNYRDEVVGLVFYKVFFGRNTKG